VDHVGVDINRGGFEGVRVDKGDAGTSGRDGVLWGLWAVDVVGAGASGFEEGEARDDELRTGGNGGRPGDDRGRCRTGGGTGDGGFQGLDNSKYCGDC